MVLQNGILPHGTREGGPLTESLNTRPIRQKKFPKTLLEKGERGRSASSEVHGLVGKPVASTSVVRRGAGH